MDWIGEDDPVSHSPLSKDYASQSNLRGFLSKICFKIKMGCTKAAQSSGRRTTILPF